MKTSQLPLDFSLNVKTEGVTNLNIHVKTADNGASMLISPEKGSQSAFKVVTPKHTDGKLIYALTAVCRANLIKNIVSSNELFLASPEEHHH